MRLIQDLINIIFPRVCSICEEALTKNEDLICFQCRSNLPKINNANIDDNELTDRFLGKFRIEFGLSFLYFYKSGITQKVLHQLKYKDNPELGELLGKWIGHEFLKYDHAKKTDMLIPVPLHPKKQRKRGYNQSYHLAKGISETTGIKINLTSLVRIQYQASQTIKTKEQRWVGLENAFSLNGENNLEGKRILLVDDIVTTGATIEACAQKLNEANVKSIGVVSLALAK